MEKISVDGHEFTKADVMQMRQEVIRWRDESFQHWPNSIQDTLSATYLVGFLNGVLDQYPNEITFDEFLDKFGHTNKEGEVHDTPIEP